MSASLYIWVSLSFHPERFGQFCSVDLKPDLYRTFSSQVEVTFNDGETFKANRTHIRADSEGNRKKYIREPEGKTKVCTRCKKEKDIKEFVLYSKGSRRLRPECRECINAYLRDWKRGKKRTQQ